MAYDLVCIGAKKDIIIQKIFQSNPYNYYKLLGEALDTLDIVRQVEFEQAFTFLYSKRPGTKAATMKGQIPREIKQDRFERLLDEVYEIFYRKNQYYLGRTEEVLVEGVSKNNDSMLTGRSEGYKIVNFSGNKHDIGKIIPVKITDFNSFALTGERI